MHKKVVYKFMWPMINIEAHKRYIPPHVKQLNEYFIIMYNVGEKYKNLVCKNMLLSRSWIFIKAILSVLRNLHTNDIIVDLPKLS